MRPVLLQRLLLLLFVAMATPVRADVSEDTARCLKCHGDAKIATMTPTELREQVRVPEGRTAVVRSPEETARLYTPEKEFASTAHKDLACAACHPGADREPHDQRLETVPCEACHTEAEKAVALGAHGGTEKVNGVAKPACLDCHGPAHRIPAATFPRDVNQAKALVQRCTTCHTEANAHGAKPFASYREGAHGKALFEKGLGVAALCTDCHGTHTVLAPADPASTVHPARVPATCGTCHQGIEQTYRAATHGKKLLEGRTDTATCTSCHASHGVAEVGPTYLRNVTAECAKCHEKEARSYAASYHGKAMRLGGDATAVCSKCHGAHDILPRDNPQSRVSRTNLVETCRQCHPKAGPNFVRYEPHMNVRDWRGQPAIFATWMAMNVLLVGVLAVALAHTALWMQRAWLERWLRRGVGAPQPGGRTVRRFDTADRLTHGLVVVSFLGLVATGFPLKYSHTQWAANMAAAFGGVRVMGMVHRCLAVVTVAYVAVHVARLARSFRGRTPTERRRWLFGPGSLLFARRDLRDLRAMLRWFLWLGPRPRFERWTYYEKFDYWGEVWGVCLIGATGLLLWAPALFGRWLPGWVFNCATVIHSIEALLAASVIVLVHFCNTHLRPGKFPVDLTMLTGQTAESEMAEERGDEYERLRAAGELEARIEPPAPRAWRIAAAAVGIAAFLVGLALIALAAATELGG